MGCILLMAVGSAGLVYVIWIRLLIGPTLCHCATSPCTLYSVIVFLGFPCGSAGKESACNEGDLGSIPGLGRSPGEGKCYPLQYSGLENPMDYIIHGVAKSQTQETFTFTWKINIDL